MRPDKTLQRILGGSRSVAFDDIVRLATAFGFVLRRTHGSHHIFDHPRIPGLVNLQPDRGKAKPYQVRQLMALVDKYQLTLKAEADR